MKKITFCFICSPGLGILENWLPILHELKNQNPNSEFLCLFTKVSSIEQTARVNVLIKIASQIFDGIVFKSYSDSWVKVKNFDEAETFIKSSTLGKYTLKLIQVLSRFSMAKYFSNILKRVYIYFSRGKVEEYGINLNDLIETIDAVLYDISEEKKEYIKEIFQNYNCKKKFSIHHGIDVFKSKRPLNPQYSLAEEKITQYTFSEYDRDYYRKSYSLRDNNIVVTGVPRHEKAWKNFIIENQIKMSGEHEWEDYVFIISRSMSDYFPYERKKKAISDIKKLVFDELKKQLVIKLHPKEKNNKLYEEILGVDNYGKKWVYSNSHPFVLAKKSLFAISFYSNVAIDMIVSDVPTIEYLDLRNIDKYDNAKSLRDINGDPVFDWRFNGLVLGASNFNQLKEQVDKVVQDRDSTLKLLRENYMDMFAPVDASSSIIAKNIITQVNATL